jgi:hypothetical protein
VSGRIAADVNVYYYRSLWSEGEFIAELAHVGLTLLAQLS